MRNCVVALSVVLVVWAASVAQAGAGRGYIEGRVSREDGSAVAGVDVTIVGTRAAATTDEDGYFVFKNLRAGPYTLEFSLLGNTLTRSEVIVEARSGTRVDPVVDWEVGLVETVIVQSVSRRRERIVDAPAAVTRVAGDKAERLAAQGELPKLLEFTPAVDFGQNDLYDFNISTRGFNKALPRRVAVFVDGREAVDPFSGGPEWATLSLPLDDVSGLELQRGPSAALWGANSTSGVMSWTTRAPRESQGGKLRVVAGELDTVHLDLRWAGDLGSGWYLKVVGSQRAEDFFAVSRLDGVEYSVPCDQGADPPVIVNCLPLDAVPFPEDNIELTTGNLRLDKHFAGGNVLTLEGGATDYEGTVFVNAGGSRGQVNRTEFPWARLNFNTEHLNVLAYYNHRESESLQLTNGTPFVLEAYNARVELQTNWSFANERVRLVAGGLVQTENVDTTAALERIENDEQALYAQVDWDVSRRVKLVGAARWDHADLHDPEISPKAGVVWKVTPRNTLRATYSEGFQVPTYLEYFLYFPLGPPLDLEESLCPDGEVCGLSATPPLALGNEDLQLEQTRMFEVGYNAVLGGKAVLTLDAYSSENDDFSTSFIPQITPAGRTNPDFGPWVPSPGVDLTEDQVNEVRDNAAAAFGPLGWQLTNFNGESIVLGFSVTNVGQVDTQGADLALLYVPSKRWRVSASYSWFDFEIQDPGPGLDAILWPNAPEHRVSGRVTYLADRWDLSLAGRWVDEFRWANGQMDGLVEAYSVFDLSGNYALNENWAFGAYVSNVFDEIHWQTFGGSQPPRRALAHATFLW